MPTESAPVVSLFAPLSFFVAFLLEQSYLCIQDHITIHAVDLGNSAPLLSNAQLVDGTGDTSALTVSILHVPFGHSVMRHSPSSFACPTLTASQYRSPPPICSTTQCRHLRGSLFRSQYHSICSSHRRVRVRLAVVHPLMEFLRSLLHPRLPFHPSLF
jgi:hypothetical protein